MVTERRETKHRRRLLTESRGTPAVSTPVTWKEVDRAAQGKTGLRFTPEQVLERVRKAGDHFRPVLELAQAMPSLPAYRK